MVHEMLKTGNVTEQATRHLLFDTLIKNAKEESTLKVVMALFDDKNPSAYWDLSLRHKHDIVQAVWSAKEFDLAKK